MSLNFARITLAFTVVLLPQIILPHIGGVALMLPYNLLTWMGISLFIGIAVHKVLSTGELKLPTYWPFLLLAVILFTVPSVYEGLDLTYVSLGAAVIAIALFFLSLFQFQEFINPRFILILIIVTGGLQALIGFAHLSGISVGLDGAYEIGQASNPVGSFQQRNLFGSYVLTAALAAALASLHWQLSPVYRTLFGLVAVLMGFVVVLSLSRSAWLAMAISVCLVLFTVNSSVAIKGLFLGIGALAAVALAAYFTIEDFGAFAGNITDRLSFHDESRTIIYLQVIDMIKDNPWLGYGRGDFESAYMHYTAARNYIDPGYPGAVLSNLAHPHNELLYWWVEGGILPIIGVGVFAWIVIRAFFQAEKHHRAFFVLLVPICVHAMVEQPLMHSVPHVLVLALVVYLLVNLVRPAPITIFNFKAIRVFGILIGTLVFVLPTLYMVNAFHNVIVLKAFSERPAKSSDLLRNIVYPGNQNTALNIIVYTELMNYALKHNDERRAQLFFNWAEQEIRYRPRLDILKNLGYSYQHFGYQDKANATTALLEYYFSDSSELDLSVEAVSESSSS